MKLIIYDFFKVVIGFKNSILQDNIRQKAFRIPKEVAEFINNFRGYEIEDIPISDHKDEILDYILKNDIGFLFEDEDFFPESKDTFFIPSLALDIIVVCSNLVLGSFKNLIEQINILRVKHCELRFYCIKSPNQIRKILSELENTTIQSLDIYCIFNPKININHYNLLAENFPIINSFIYYGFPLNVIDDLIKKNYMTYDNFIITHKFVNEKTCGNINMDYFSINHNNYRFSKNYNSCLYKKIAVDENGNIKNCPSMTESFGNIRDTTLAEAIEKPGFKKYWDINKDKIHVCKDCEFRYICTDCRAYVEDPDDILSKPLKCGYNPYIGEWSEWSTNPLKQKAIDFYGMREMVDEMNKADTTE